MAGSVFKLWPAAVLCLVGLIKLHVFVIRRMCDLFVVDDDVGVGAAVCWVLCEDVLFLCYSTQNCQSMQMKMWSTALHLALVCFELE